MHCGERWANMNWCVKLIGLLGSWKTVQLKFRNFIKVHGKRERRGDTKCNEPQDFCVPLFKSMYTSVIEHQFW